MTEQQKEAKRARERARYAAYAEHIKAQRRAWRAAHPEQAKARHRAWRKLHPGYDNAWYKAHPEGARERARRQHTNNPEEHRKRCRQWRAAHPGYVAAWHRARKKVDVGFRLSCALRSRLCKALKSRGLRKTTATMKLAGCSLNFLRNFLEAQFQPGMSWENYGAWHIDHLRPCAAFDLRDPAQQKECFHFSNLQPLWATENWKKNDKY